MCSTTRPWKPVKEATVAMRVPISMILDVLAVSVLLFFLFTPCPAQECQVAASEAIRRSPDTPSNEGERFKLPLAVEVVGIAERGQQKISASHIVRKIAKKKTSVRVIPHVLDNGPAV